MSQAVESNKDLEAAGSRRCVFTRNAPPPIGPYCQANIAGPFVFTAAVGGNAPGDDGALSSGITAQTERAIANLDAILRASGCTLANVARVTAYLSDLKYFGEMNAVYARFFKHPYPARSIVETASPAPGALVSFDAIALRPNAPGQDSA